jgi:hypothetical protein
MSRDEIYKRHLRRARPSTDRYSPSRYNKDSISLDLTTIKTEKNERLRSTSFSNWLKEASLKWIKPFLSHFEKENGMKVDHFKKCHKTYTLLNSPRKNIHLSKKSLSSIPIVHSQNKNRKDTLTSSNTQNDKLIQKDSILPLTPSKLSLPKFRPITKSKRLRKSTTRYEVPRQDNLTDEFFEKLHRKYEKLEKQAIRRDKERQLHVKYKDQLRVQEEQQREVNRQLTRFGRVDWEYIDSMKLFTTSNHLPISVTAPIYVNIHGLLNDGKPN